MIVHTVSMALLYEEHLLLTNPPSMLRVLFRQKKQFLTKHVSVITENTILKQDSSLPKSVSLSPALFPSPVWTSYMEPF